MVLRFTNLEIWSLQTMSSCFSSLQIMSRGNFECDICHKSFNRKSNLVRHRKRHNDDSQYECEDCGKVFSRSDTLYAHKQSKHSSKSRKGTLSEEKPPESKRLNVDVNEHFMIKKINKTRMNKFKTTKTLYKVKFKDLHVTGLRDILNNAKRNL